MSRPSNRPICRPALPALLAACLGAAAAAADSTGTVRVVTAFPANRGPGWKQTIDVAGAVGPRHVVAFDEGGFVVQEKATGREVQRFAPREFWRRVQPAHTLVPQAEANDPRILYDPLAERWYACAAGTTVADCFLAVSTSADPTGPWKGVKLPLPPIDPYMKMGLDKHALYICSCNGDPDWRKGMNCYVIPKQDVLAPDGPLLHRAQTFTGLIFALMPALDLDPRKPPEAPHALLINEFSEGLCRQLFLYRLTWSAGRAALSAPQTIPLSRTYYTPATNLAVQPAPGPRLRAGGGNRRLESAFVFQGSLFGCHGAKRAPDSRPGILWYEIRLRDGALLQEGFVEDAHSDYLHPSLAVDARGNLGLGCTRTSETEYPSVYVLMRAPTDPPHTLRPPVLAMRGTTCYRYGDYPAINLSHYSSTCVDPVAPGRLWTYQAYGNSPVDKQWCTAWAAFELAAPE
ncbi:MAG: hypothetical protein N3J91_06345 [Verrucomicrobiae bacterium]|nr:hypothetical protein [Verrucomicrobiae bacterium]